MKGTDATEVLQAVTILHIYDLRQADSQAGRSGKQVRPVSAKRTDMLKLPLSAWQQYANDVEQGFRQAAQLLKKEYFYARSELPYGTQVAPLAAVMTKLGTRWLEPRIYEKLARWYWCGVLDELYEWMSYSLAIHSLLVFYEPIILKRLYKIDVSSLLP